MNTVKVSHAEALKAEIMERYGLREDQVRLQLTIHTIDLELGRKVLADFDRDTQESYLPEGDDCDMVYGNDVNTVYVHTKDGFYGTYINEKEDDSDE